MHLGRQHRRPHEQEHPPGAAIMGSLRHFTIDPQSVVELSGPPHRRQINLK
jgi:hypothetical protein